MTYGYARVSTDKQSIERQITNILRESPSAIIYSEKCSAKTQDREQWKRLLKAVKTGDTIIFDEVSRMSRNEEEGVREYFELYNRGINLIFIKEPLINTDIFRKALEERIESQKINCSDEIYSKFMNNIIDSFNELMQDIARKQIRVAFYKAEKERVAISQRTKDILSKEETRQKISNARTGKTYTTPKELFCRDLIIKHSKSFNGSLKDEDLIDLITSKLREEFPNKEGNQTLSRKTFYKYKRAIVE